MANQVYYQNWWSKLLFRKKFENQFFIPLPMPWLEKKLFEWCEKIIFSTSVDELIIDRPIFIVGLPRSGTTVLYNLLCAHEAAAYVTNSMNSFPEALESIEWLRKKFSWNIKGERFLQDSIEVDFGSPSEPLTLWGKWMNRDVQSLYWPEQSLADLPSGRGDEIKRDIKKILRSFGGIGRRFVLKYPIMQTELKIVQQLFPDAKFIHILRDPRMAANSLVKLYRLSNTQLRKINHPSIKKVVPYPRIKNLSKYIEEYGVDRLECTARVWRDSVQLVRERAPDLNSYYEVRYEDLIKSPKEQLEKLFQFCEWSWPDSGNEKFKKEFEKVGVIQHSNTYDRFDEIAKITSPLSQELGY